MNPDLRKSHISNLWFSTSCIIPEEVRKKIEQLSPPRDQISRFFDVYVYKRITHRCSLSIEFKKDDAAKPYISFEYRAVPSPKLAKKTPKISDIIDDLCVVEGEHDFSCYSIIEYPKREKRKFVINLPLKISESPDMPINSIDGLSVEGRVESQKYSALLLVSPNGEHKLTLFFKKKYSFSKSLPHNIISDMKKILDKLVF